MDVSFALLALDVPPDYTIRLIEAGYDTTTLQIELNVKAYDGLGWAENTFVSDADLDNSFSPPDFTVTDVHVFTISDASDRLECNVTLKASDGTQLAEIGAGTSTYDAPFLTPRTLIDLACIDLADEDEVDDPDLADVDVRFDFAYLTWSVVSDLVVVADPKSGSPPFSTAIYLSGGSDQNTFPDCWEFRPSSQESLVVDSVEWEAPTEDFLNWRDWNVSENGLVTSNDFAGVFHKPRGSTATCRSMEDIDSVILHETAGWQMDRIRFVPERWQIPSRPTAGTQFKVLTDGTIVQMYDVVQRTSHIAAGGFNSHSVGIEIVNIIVLRELRNRSESQVARSHNRWEGRDSVFVYEPTARVIRDKSPRPLVKLNRRDWGIVPTLPQLEATYRLVTFLQRLGVGVASMLGLPGLPFPADLSSTEGADRFLVDTWTSEMQGMVGILSHSVVQGNRDDGDIPVLYCWLRSSSTLAGWGPEAAYGAVMDLYDWGLDNFRCSDGARRLCIDTAGLAPPRHVRSLIDP